MSAIRREGRDVRTVFVDFDRESRTLRLLADNEETLAWLHHYRARSVVGALSAVFLGRRVCEDPWPGEVEPPGDCITPSRLATALESELRIAFPDEDISVTAKGRAT